MRVMGTRYKRPENKQLRQPPQNIRIKKLSRPYRAEGSGGSLLAGMKVEGKEIGLSISNVPASEHKDRRDGSTELQPKRCGTEDKERQRTVQRNLQNNIQNKKSIADGSTAAESSLGQSDDASPHQRPGETGHFQGLEAQVQKRQQQKLYMEQLKEQIKEKDMRNGDRSFGVCGNRTANEYSKSQQKRMNSEILGSNKAADEGSVNGQAAEPAAEATAESSAAEPRADSNPSSLMALTPGFASITGSHRRHVQHRFDLQLEARGNPFNRDEERALKEKREAQRLQIKSELEAQIAERQKARQEHEKAVSGQVSSPCLDVVEEQTKEIPPPAEAAAIPQVGEKVETEVKVEKEEKDVRLGVLKTRIEDLNKENQELLKKLESKEQVITTLKNEKTLVNRMPRTKHKVVASADNKRREERKLKELSFYKNEKANSIDKKILEARERIQNHKMQTAMKARSMRNVVKAVNTISLQKPQLESPVPRTPTIQGGKKTADSAEPESDGKSRSLGKNLDNDCHSCLIFPDKDGSFVIPQEGKTTLQDNKLTFSEKFCPEDELDQLMREYNQSKKEYISKVSEKLTSYNKSPMFPELSISNVGDFVPDCKRNSSVNSISPVARSPMCLGSKAGDFADVCRVRKVMSGAPIRPVNHYESNIANIVSKTRAINSAYFQSRKEPPINCIRPAGADSTTTGFKPNIGSRFPREIFSLNYNKPKQY